MADNTPSIKISRINSPSIDLKEVAAGIVETFANFFIKGAADGGVSSLTSLVKAVTSIRADEPVEARAWRITALSFGWAVGHITDNNDGVSAEALKALRASLDAAKQSIDNGASVMPRTFLSRPTTIDLYVEMRHRVIEERYHIFPSLEGSDDVVSAKLDIAFNRAVFEVWSRRPEYFSPLADALNSPGALAMEYDAGWTANRHALKQAFHVKPVFGQQSVSLSQLYVPLRAYWKDEADHSRLYSGSTMVPETAQFLMLDDAFDEWLSSNEEGDWLRLIGGGPGSGKSTTLRALASRYADREDWRPLYIPLQHIGLSNDLRDSINKFFTESSDGAFSHPPLTRAAAEDGPPLLLIFDGLDELIAPNEAASDVIAQFAGRLNALMLGLQGDAASRHRVVISGRLPSFQLAKRFIHAPAQGQLEVFGYIPVEDHSGRERSDLENVDQRATWWSRYAQAKGLSEDIPAAISSEELSSITHEPLLCYLLVVAGYAEHDWEKAAANTNLIYASLMNDVYERGWGEGRQKRHGPGRSMKIDQFNLLMETIGLAAWLGGDARVASEHAFTEACKVLNSSDAWLLFKDENGPDVTNLAMNFYLKSAEDVHRGFEFTHKSFGEYLAARALLRVSEEMHDLSFRRIDLAMSEWFNATSTGTMTVEVLMFMRNEVRLRMSSNDMLSIERSSKIKSSFEKMADAAMSDGFNSSGRGSWRVQEQQQISSEHSCWAVINSYAFAIADAGYHDKAMVNVNFDDPYALRSLLTRQNRKGRFTSTFGFCLSFIRAYQQILYYTHFYNADFTGADLRYAFFDGSAIYETSFSSARLDYARFSAVRLMGVDFTGTYSKSIIFESSRIEDCQFDNAQIDCLVLDLYTCAMSDDRLDNIANRIVRTMHSHDPELFLTSDRLHEATATMDALPKASLDDYRDIDD